MAVVSGGRGMTPLTAAAMDSTCIQKVLLLKRFFAFIVTP
jgi:hypothetical protein